MAVALALLVGATMFSQPSITTFAHDMPCAFSMEFDDSMPSQVKNLLPLLTKYKFPATFYLNPGWPHYQANKDVWERQILASGHEIGDHTMHHRDTVGADQAASEIGDAAKILHRVVGHRAMMPFAIPGGVKWDIPREDFERILRENDLFLPGREDFYQDGHGDILKQAKRALEGNTWHRLGFHGVGGEWLSTSLENITTMLDFLDKNRGKIWIAPTGVIWKYQREREAVSSVAIDAKGQISWSIDKAKMPNPELYDVPLTVRLSVYSEWKQASVTIDGQKSLVPVKDGTLLFDFLPTAKSVRVAKG